MFETTEKLINAAMCELESHNFDGAWHYMRRALDMLGHNHNHPVGYVTTTGLINRFKWRFDMTPELIGSGQWNPVFREQKLTVAETGRVFAPVGYATAGLAQLVARYGSYETIVSAHPSHMWEKLPLRLYADVTPGGAV